MKVKLNSELLKDVIFRVAGGLSSFTLASKSVVLIADSESGILKFITNNIKIGYIARMPAEYESDGKGVFAVDGVSFSKYVKAVKSSEVTVELEKEKVVLHDGKRNISIGVYADVDVHIPPIGESEIATVGAMHTASVLKAAMNCATQVDSYSIMDGIHITANSIEATDGAKIVMIPFESNLSQEIVITKDAAREFIKNGYGGDVVLHEGSNFISFDVGTEVEGITNVYQLLDGKYPDIKKLNDKYSYEHNVVVSISEMLSQLNFVSLVSDNKDQSATLYFDSADVLRLQAVAYMQNSDSDAEVVIDPMESNPLIGFEFNVKISDIISMLKSFSEIVGADTEITIHHKENSPLKFEYNGVIGYVSGVKF